MHANKGMIYLKAIVQFREDIQLEFVFRVRENQSFCVFLWVLNKAVVLSPVHIKYLAKYINSIGDLASSSLNLRCITVMFTMQYYLVSLLK